MFRNASINKLSKWIFIFVSIVSLVGLALGIAGAIKALDSYTIPPMLQAALGMFVGCLGLLLAILGYLTIYRNEMPRNEKIILYSVHACAPLLIVRTVYGCLGDYTTIARFNLFEPNPTVNLCMGVLEEIILMVICLAVGFYCPPPKEPQPGKSGRHFNVINCFRDECTLTILRCCRHDEFGRDQHCGETLLSPQRYPL